MIVLDEQLLRPGIRESLEQWYPGRVMAITELRPGSIILDDAIPELLRSARHPTFVTINVTDFWRHIPADPRYCVACMPLSDNHMQEISQRLRRLFRLKGFRTQASRLGKIAWVGSSSVRYYDAKSPKIVHVAFLSQD